MAHAELRYRACFARRVLGRLPCDAVDEVGGDARHARGQRCTDRIERLVGAVPSAEKTQAFGVEPLHADAQAVHPDVQEGARGARSEATRVALDGDLDDISRGRERLLDPGEHPAELLRAPQRRGAPAEEDGAQGARAELRAPRFDLAQYRVRVGLVRDVFLRGRNAQKVAIRAFFHTPGEVDIDAHLA